MNEFFLEEAKIPAKNSAVYKGQMIRKALNMRYLKTGEETEAKIGKDETEILTYPPVRKNIGALGQVWNPPYSGFN